jgi:hypothetical protein
MTVLFVLQHSIKTSFSTLNKCNDYVKKIQLNQEIG